MNQDCNICGGTLEDGFCRNPLLFGKHPGPICFACFTVPAQPPDWQRGDPKPLHTVDDMISFGWSQKEAKFHLRAVKRFLRIRTPRARSSDSDDLGPQAAQETASPPERTSVRPSSLQMAIPVIETGIAVA
jgi:hypothetical protein